jgi:hypothetical protein
MNKDDAINSLIIIIIVVVVVVRSMKPKVATDCGLDDRAPVGLDL